MSAKLPGKQTVEVSVLGQRLVLKADDDPRHLERVAAYVQRKVNEVAASGPVSTQKVALLAALNIGDDYLRMVDEMRELKRQVAARSRAMLAELDGC